MNRRSRRPAPAALRAQDPIDAVRRINRRWIVRGGLCESAAGYLDALETNDPARLARSCEMAMALAHSDAAGEDPKPWFYGGLFAEATRAEARSLLAEHPLTWLVWQSLHDSPRHDGVPESLRALCGEIVAAIREHER